MQKISWKLETQTSRFVLYILWLCWLEVTLGRLWIIFWLLQEVLSLACTEFKENLTTMNQDGLSITRGTSYSGLRYLLSEVNAYTIWTCSVIVLRHFSPPGGVRKLRHRSAWSAVTVGFSRLLGLREHSRETSKFQNVLSILHNTFNTSEHLNVIDVFVVSVKYRIPSVFFNPNAKQSAQQQALDMLNAHQLDHPEACFLHSSSEVPPQHPDFLKTWLTLI